MFKDYQFLNTYTNSKGNIALVISFLLPMATLFSLLCFFQLSLFEQKKYFHICQESLLKALTPLSYLANELESLNPRALRLQKKEARAMKALRAAPSPKAKAAAMAYLVKVKTEQYAFRGKQQSLIRKYEAKASIVWNRSLNTHQLISKSRRLKLKFQPYPTQSDSPIYKPKLNFANQQMLKANWKRNLAFNKQSNVLKGSCYATLTKERRWHPAIQKAKAL